jgi:polyadenylate-binding protein
MALEQLNFEVVMGRAMRIMWCDHDPTLRKSGVGNIVIKKLEKTIDNKTLHQTMTVFGPILSSKIAIDDNGESKGYAYVHFQDENIAKQAAKQLDGMELAGKKLVVNKFVKKTQVRSPNFWLLVSTKE